jgi:hypothetical protein
VFAEANGVLSVRALHAAAAQDELRALSSVRERDQAHRFALFEEIYLFQTWSGKLRQQLRIVGK